MRSEPWLDISRDKLTPDWCMCAEVMSKRKKAKKAIVKGLLDVTKTAETLLSDSDSSPRNSGTGKWWFVFPSNAHHVGTGGYLLFRTGYFIYTVSS